MRETMRVLMDHGSVDVHQGYEPGEIGCWNKSTSSLHLFRGTSEDFLWLITREDAFVTAESSADYTASIVLQQSSMYPNDSFPAAFSQVSNMRYMAQYKDSSGFTLLHNLLDTNFGTELGVWQNGLEVWSLAKRT